MSAREEYEATVAGLVGTRILAVDYWDVALDGPPSWDAGELHVAVMGVDLMTGAGPRSVQCTSTFDSYGVELVTEAITPPASGPQRWPATDHARWRTLLDQPVTAVRTHWEPFEVLPGTSSTGQVAPGRRVDVPVAIRLDVATGSVWFVATWPSDGAARGWFGDEVAVVFTREAMVELGFPDSPFTRP